MCARVGLGQTRLPFYIIPELRFSAVPNSRNSKSEKFSFPLKKIGRAQNLKKCRENFSGLERKFLQNLRAESGAEAKNRNQDFLQKKFEFHSANPTGSPCYTAGRHIG